MLTILWDQPSLDIVTHYLMFGCWPYLPINFYFPMVRGRQKYQCVDHYITELCERLWEAFKEAQVQSTSEAERHKWHYTRKANTISLEAGDLVLVKANGYGGKKGEWSVEGRTIWRGVPICRRHPFPPFEKPVDQTLMSPSPKLPFSHCFDRRYLSLCDCAGQVGQVHHHQPRGNKLRKVRLRKHHKVKVVHCQPSIRQVRLL